jgi:hypothetical protein
MDINIDVGVCQHTKIDFDVIRSIINLHRLLAGHNQRIEK